MVSVSKNVYIDKLDDIAGENNNKHHRTIKIIHILVLRKMVMIKVLNLKLVIT